MKGKLYGIGVGPGDPDLLTLKAANAFRNADVVYLPKSEEQASTVYEIVKKHLPVDIQLEAMAFSMSRDIEKRKEVRKHNALMVQERLENNDSVVFVTLGDPMLYSTFSYLLEYLDPAFEVETIPGIYSFSAISGLLSMPLCKGEDKLLVLSSFDENTPSVIKNVETVVLMKVSSFNIELHEFMVFHPEYDFIMIINAGKSNQKVYHDIGILKDKIPYFSTAIIKKNN